MDQYAGLGDVNPRAKNVSNAQNSCTGVVGEILESFFSVPRRHCSSDKYSVDVVSRKSLANE